MEITKDEFERYVEVQESGVTNMFDVAKVEELSGLTKEQCFAIMKRYSYLKNKFKEKAIC